LVCVFGITCTRAVHKGPRYRDSLQNASVEIDKFRKACANAKIPEIEARKSLRDIIEWSLFVLSSWRPKFIFTPPDGSGDYEFDLFGSKEPNQKVSKEEGPEHLLPKYVNEIKETLEAVLNASQLSLWLMVDRLDEIFPRRSEVERLALRGLLRAMRYFASGSIRVKVFLRDDILEQVVRGDSSFTALTHVTVRQADTIRWSQDQIMAMVVKRFFSNDPLTEYLQVNREQIDASTSYRNECFYKLFPPTVFRGPKQSQTNSWICNRCADGRGVVTPRDVLDLLIRAIQKQQDICSDDPEGTSEWIISAAAIQYGFEELSQRKRLTYLQAEFPHLWKQIEKFHGGKTDYTTIALRALLGTDWKSITEHLLAIGFLSKGSKGGEDVFSVPFLYRHGMNLTQGKA
jgi:hypothetical protein